MVSFEMNDRKKIGLGLTGFGVFFSFLGIIFLFDKGLIAMGNILFLSGVILTIGLKSSMQFFMKRSNFKGTVSFGLGFILVIIGWPIIGMIIEAYGFVVLFSGFWPTLAVFLQKIPILGWLLQQPFVRSKYTFIARIYHLRTMPKPSSVLIYARAYTKHVYLPDVLTALAALCSLCYFALKSYSLVDSSLIHNSANMFQILVKAQVVHTAPLRKAKDHNE
ncbi:UNVERIFIED_CONTAM: Vesicle transport protein GOT1 [Sesamum radiatum]|uniref:Vesicle transport protein GOT1 n=1 Tax=Sesamum radiatum TaxID=300843 RepID=A0AAW2UPZ3_SESRA